MWLRRFVVVLLALFLAAVGGLYWARRGASQGSVFDDNIFLIGIVVLGLVTYFTACIVQWHALLKFSLSCWSCERPLATKVRVFWSPNSYCPHCGQKALVSDP